LRAICFVVTTPFAVNAFLLTHMKALADRCPVTLCVNRSLYPLSDDIDPRIRVVDFPIAREISLLKDLRAFLFLVSWFRAERVAAVHSITPKAGLLAMLAARLAGIRLRHHTFTGQVWATKSGIARSLLKTFDRVIVRAASQVFADSSSQCRFLEDERVVKPGGISVLGPGSIAGVDVGRFRPDVEIRRQVRAEMDSSDDLCVFLFVGRLTRDKGVFDLVEAFTTVAAANPRVELWLVGPDEEGLSEQLERRSRHGTGRVRWLGQTSQPERYMASADVLVLPSYREGFGSVVIEAAACAVPTIAYRIDGLIDAVVEERTGLLVELRNIDAFAAAMLALSLDPARRNQLGRQALDRAAKEFSGPAVTAEWMAFYERVL
jgi:glycosyltransferase involved in cell wall biosynthesis